MNTVTEGIISTEAISLKGLCALLYLHSEVIIYERFVYRGYLVVLVIVYHVFQLLCAQREGVGAQNSRTELLVFDSS